MQELAKHDREKVFVEEPIVAFPLFRFLKAWSCSGGARMWGLQVHGAKEMSAGSFVVNIWSDRWKNQLVEQVMPWLRSHLARRRKHREAPRGAFAAADHQNMVGRALSCEGYFALMSAGVEASVCHEVLATAIEIADEWGTFMVANEQRILDERGARLFATIYLEAALNKELCKDPDWTDDRLVACAVRLQQTLGVDDKEHKIAIDQLVALLPKAELRGERSAGPKLIEL